MIHQTQPTQRRSPVQDKVNAALFELQLSEKELCVFNISYSRSPERLKQAEEIFRCKLVGIYHGLTKEEYEEIQKICATGNRRDLIKYDGKKELVEMAIA